MSSEIEPVYQAVGARIRMLREMLDRDQASLAKAVGLTRTSIVNLEAGRQRVQLHQLSALAKALGTSEKCLLRGIWI